MRNDRAPLARRLDELPPRPEDVAGEDVLDRFLAYVKEKNLDLYPAQEEAILELFDGKNVILNTPTGSGKSLVATAMHFRGLATKRRSFYTSPIKALVSEKFFALCREVGPDYVGMITGDASVNHDAPIICCTAEILANMALRDGAEADVDDVVMDEFHYYADKERGVAWQIPLLVLRHATFLLMSATLGPTELFEESLTKLTGKKTAVVRSTSRPVPLDYAYRDTPLHETILDLTKKGRAPIYVVCFTQRSCAEEAQNLMSTDYSTKDEKKAIYAALEGVRFDSPYGKEIQKFIRHGVGVHHAGLLPKYRLLVEKLAQKGHLKVICGTDTLGVGVNIPIRTVLFTKLCKYDGEKTSILSVREFQQISGRAGRKGFDDLGTVAVQAPEHVIENLRLEAKAGNDPVKKKRIVRRKPPEKGYVHWDKGTFDRLTSSPPEPLVSRFKVTHGMLLNVLQRGRGGCKAMARIIRDSHERPAQKRIHGRHAIALFKSLVAANIVEVTEDKRVVLHADLQDDFSLNQTLSLYLHHSIGLLDRESPTYALDVLTQVESILENPDLILMKQLDKLKTEKMAEMKAAGVEYDERIAELEKLEYPKPNKEFVYDTFNAFAKQHPWVAASPSAGGYGHGENIRPKSIAREMFETYQSFAEYVREYELQRAEGLVLRYLSDVYKALVQTVPLLAKTAEVDEIVTYFRTIVRVVDSSLIDEWERMRAPEAVVLERPDAAEEPAPFDVTSDDKAFTVLIRNELFALLRALAKRDYQAAAAMLDAAAEPWTPVKLEAALAPFHAEHGKLRTDPAARAPSHTRITKTERGVLEIEQVLCDAEDANDWAMALTIDLERAREAGRPLLALERIGA